MALVSFHFCFLIETSLSGSIDRVKVVVFFLLPADAEEECETSLGK